MAFSQWIETTPATGAVAIFDLKEMFPEWPYETFAAREPWLAKEKAQVVKFLRAYQRGVRHTLENREDGIAALRKYVKIDPAYAPAGYDQYRNSFPLNGAIAEKAIAVVIDQEFENGRIKRKISVEELLDRSFIKSIGGK